MPKAAPPLQGTLHAEDFIPQFRIIVTAPEMNSSRMQRMYYRCTKSAIETTLKKHDLERMPKHFHRGNWQRYNHAPRKAITLDLKRKRKQSPVDLVKTGAMKRSFDSQYPKIKTFGPTGGRVVGKLTKTFPHRIDPPRSSGIGPEQIVKELETWSVDDIKGATVDFQYFFMEAMERDQYYGKKIKKIFGANIAAARAALG